MRRITLIMIDATSSLDILFWGLGLFSPVFELIGLDAVGIIKILQPGVVSLTEYMI
jgi:hypothetical protein